MKSWQKVLVGFLSAFMVFLIAFTIFVIPVSAAEVEIPTGFPGDSTPAVVYYNKSDSTYYALVGSSLLAYSSDGYYYFGFPDGNSSYVNMYKFVSGNWKFDSNIQYYYAINSANVTSVSSNMVLPSKDGFAGIVMEVGVILNPPEPPLVTVEMLEGIAEIIVGLIPYLIPCVVGLIAFRKGWGMLKTQLVGA